MQSRTIYTFVLLAIIQTCIFADPVAQTFSDTQQFIDLSTYNFYLGRNAIYASLFTARPGKQVRFGVLPVSLYLFQNSVKQYSIHVYDGDSDQSREINIQGKIPQNIDYVEYPEAIVSTSGKMYVVVTADNTDPRARVDFQAMATDISQPAGCGKLAVTLHQNNNATIFELFANCTYVFHANDPGNNLFLTQTVQEGFNTISQEFTLYKGLKTDDAHKLMNNKAITNLRASDKYLVFKPTADIAFTHYWSFQSGYVQAPVVGLYTRDSLMTVDYLQNEYPTFIGQVEQSFIIRRYPPVTAVQLTFVNLLGTGSLTVSTYMNNNLTAQPINYTPANFHGPFNITYTDCDQIELAYSIANRSPTVDSGFYALYSDVSNYQILPSTAPTVTSRPIQTTTKASANFFRFYFIISLIVLLFP